MGERKISFGLLSIRHVTMAMGFLRKINLPAGQSIKTAVINKIGEGELSFFLTKTELYVRISANTLVDLGTLI